MEKGTHLLLDCRTTASAPLGDMEVIYDLLETIPASIGMTVVVPPVVVRFPHVAGEMERLVAQLRGGSITPHTQSVLALAEQSLRLRATTESGLSGFVIIAESHFSIHTWPEKNYFSADLYSCKGFDSDQVMKHISSVLNIDPKQSKIQVVERGLEDLAA